ncbi:peroxidase family protein [Tropicimonas sp. S265A]|uniref:peroxidase family protein n=1 Tax=Tropicimonas sp. S265A TaxID=3415134 RepID=UPI003C7B3001
MRFVPCAALAATLAAAYSPASATTLSLDFLQSVANGTHVAAPLPPTVADVVTPLARVATPDYGGTNDDPAGANRPSPRALSNALSVPMNVQPDPIPMSNLAVAFSQLMASHEIARSPAGGPDLNIEVAPDDPVATSIGGVPVMRQTRSLFVGGGAQGPREQLNDVSQEFDGSTIYGSDAATQDLLRRNDGSGKLLLDADGGLPIIGGRRKSGDVRADENLVLQKLHEVFNKDHNRIAEEIAAGCSANGLSCSGDEIFYSAKQIVTARQNTIYYDEFLPIFLGTDDLMSLVPDQSLLQGGPRVLNEFTTAAGRIGHTQVPATITAALPGETPRSEKIEDCIFSEACLAGETLGALLFGAATLEASPIDTVVTDGLRNGLAFGFGSPLLIDLFATNINRGRDHGLADYMEVRAALGFADAPIETLLSQEILDLYGNEDIDLLVGLFAEAKNGGYLGETGKALWALQMELLRPDTPDWMGHWTSGLTMARLIADNTEVMEGDFAVSAFLAPVAPVPLPAPLAMLGVGVLGLAAMRRRARS